MTTVPGSSKLAGESTNASYRESVQAAGVTGAASITQIALRMVRSKVVAVVIGPEGIGLFGMLGSALRLASTIAALGVQTSGVRQVAAALKDESGHQLAVSVFVLRRIVWVLGALGSLAVFVFSEPVARWTTGSIENAHYVKLLAPVVLFTVVSGGQRAVLRGLRRIGTLAKLNILGAAAGTIVGVPLVLFLGLDGIPLLILFGAAFMLLASSWFARAIAPPEVPFERRELSMEAGALFGLGFAFLVTGVQTSAVQFGSRAILLHQTDIRTVGQFMAAATLSQVYVNFILQSMALDYLPRLTAEQDDPAACNRLVNEQTEVVVLLGSPGILALLVLAPVLVPIFYSGRFGPAVEVFRWQCLGVVLKLMCWPIGFLLIARGLKWLFAGKETFVNVVYMTVFWVLAGAAGLLGAALAYPLFYVVNLVLLLVLVKRVSGFRWSPDVRRVMFVSWGAIALVLAAGQWLPPAPALVTGIATTGITGLWALRELQSRLDVPIVATVLQKASVLARGMIKRGK